MKKLKIAGVLTVVCSLIWPVGGLAFIETYDVVYVDVPIPYASYDAAVVQQVIVTGNRCKGVWVGNYCTEIDAFLTHLPLKNFAYGPDDTFVGQYKATFDPKTIADAAQQIADGFTPPCVKVNELPQAYVLRARVECIKWAADGLTVIPTKSLRVTVAAHACQTRDAAHSLKVNDPAPSDYCPSRSGTMIY